MMRIRFALLLVGVLILSLAAAKADTIPPGDPDVEVGGGSLSSNVGLTFDITVGSPNCTVNNNANYFCFDGFNASNVVMTSLELDFPNAISNLTCGVLAFFSDCTVFNGGKSILFSGGTGIPLTSGHFFVAFLGIDPGTDVSAQANVPEPATLGLFLTGIGALVARRRLRKV